MTNEEQPKSREELETSNQQLEVKIALLEEKNRYYKKLVNEMRSKQRQEVVKDEYQDTFLYKWGLKLFRMLRPFPEQPEA